MALITDIRQTSRRSNPFKPTKKEFWIWFKKLNNEIFEGKIKKFRKVTFKKCRYMWAESQSVQLWSNHTPKRPIYYIDLIMKDSYPSKKQFIEILAHELIHAYQYQHHDEMTHGQTFWEWKEVLAKHDINLTEYTGSYSVSGEYGNKTLPLTF
jgi:hypothetical protein